MKSVAMAEAESRFSSLVEEIRNSHEAIEIVDHKSGESAAYLIEAETFKRLRGIEDSFRALRLRHALSGPMYDLEEVLADLGLDQ